MANKKIKNAKTTSFEGINFKSSLEKTIYKALVENDIIPNYETVTYTLSPSIRPSKPFYVRGGSKGFHYEMKPLSAITYTPDFTFILNDTFVVIEVKGFENDVYYLKKNLFRKLIEHENKPIMFFEVRTKKELLEALKVIKMETLQIKNIRELVSQLPEKDITAANKYLEERDFEELQQLVNYSIKKIEKDRKKNNIEERKYNEVDLDSLYILQSELLKIIPYGEHTNEDTL